MARDSSSSSGSGSQKAWDNAYLQDDFVRTATPERLPDPDTEETIDPGARHPFQPCIVDFSFPRIRAGHLPVVERPTMDELLYTHGPARLMRERHDSTNPSLRWVHLPCNSMQYAEALMERVCAELGMNSFVARGVIMSDERWGSRLHRKTEGTSDGYHATFMQTTCSEIAIDDEFLEDVGDELERAKYRHAGANIALFMPFLHWGTEAELDWRDGKIEEIERLRKQSRNGRFRYPFDQGASELSRFYTRLMTDQLFGDRPLHLRRTLDQFYYFSASNTAARDRDQVVSKFGPERANVGSRPLLMVDQLWLWVLGGSTLITCFDRSLEDNDDVHFNLLDHVLWKLSTQARRIQSAYELAHLVIYEASGFIFKYSYSIPRARRFHEIFRSAIATVSNAQTDIFAQLERLCHDGPTMELSRKDQNELFDIGKELSQVKEVRDIIDELVIIAQVYEQQLSIMPALFDMQYSDALFWAGKDDLDGKHLPRDLRRMVFESDSSGSGSGSGGDTAAEGASAENSDQRNERKERKEQKAEKKERMPSRKWDERGWFNRTRQYTEKHRDAVLDMINETERVYNAVGHFARRRLGRQGT